MSINSNIQFRSSFLILMLLLCFSSPALAQGFIWDVHIGDYPCYQGTNFEALKVIEPGTYTYGYPDLQIQYQGFLVTTATRQFGTGGISGALEECKPHSQYASVSAFAQPYEAQMPHGTVDLYDITCYPPSALQERVLWIGGLGFVCLKFAGLA